MKKAFWMVLVLAVVVSFAGAAFAANVEGTVKSVNAADSKLEVETAAGASWVAYTATTEWPHGVTDPASLVGEQVSIATDDAGAATSVSSAVAAM